MAGRTVAFLVFAILLTYLVLACADGNLPVRDPSMDGYWDTSITISDAMTWDEWCTGLGAFLTQGDALERNPDALWSVWKESARAGGMTRHQYTTAAEYCGTAWRSGAPEPTFTDLPALHLAANEFGLWVVPPKYTVEELAEGKLPDREMLLMRWCLAHSVFSENHAAEGFTATEIGTAWMRAARLMGFTWEDRNEAISLCGKALRLYSPHTK